MKEVIFVNSHPIQYFAPMYERMNELGVKTSCWYCTDASVKGGIDKQFGVEVKWDIPLLKGYDFKFFKNSSWRPSHANGFFGLINIGMIRNIFKIPKSVIVVHGWHYFTLFFILMLGRACGHTVCLRCDVPYNQELLKKGLVQYLKKIGLKYFLFPRIDKFLYIGQENKLFYEHFGVNKSKLLSCPYAVDNERFQNEYFNLSKKRDHLKQLIGIPLKSRVIVFSAKYIDKKRPLDLLRAFKLISNENLWLIMVGEGELRGDMEDLIRSENIKNVILTGFVNQSVISEYYIISDLFVMCSGLGENWGLSVNEAMNFNLPLVISDLSGCAADLVVEGMNGYIFKTGNIKELAVKIKQVLVDDALIKPISSIDIVNKYSYEVVSRNLSLLIR
jgi:glycosyltransferase involved in cell wall biosynthesis